MALLALVFCGCIMLPREKLPDSTDVDVVLRANPDNVYRTAEDIMLKRVKVQDKSGKWVDSKYPIIIPSGYYIGSGIE